MYLFILMGVFLMVIVAVCVHRLGTMVGSKKSRGEVQESGGEAAASSAPTAKKQKTLQGFFGAP